MPASSPPSKNIDSASSPSDPLASASTRGIEAQAERLIQHIRQFSSCVVAFSGGVDSSVVAMAAHQALGAGAVAITGLGPAFSRDDLEIAREVARCIGIEHQAVETKEIDDPAYVANDGRRCFHCKSNLYARLETWARHNQREMILSGTNFEDLSDYRPGLEAAADYRVHAPLATLGYGKETVRALAEHWRLPVAQRPASPCLASRIAYGESVTLEKLRRVELGERWLSEHGFRDVRVRLHAGDLARIEVSSADLPRLVDPSLSQALTEYFRGLGFQFVTVDLQGRQSGSLNRLLPILSS